MKILVTGCQGQVGWELVRCLLPLGEIIGVSRREVDLSDLDKLKSTIGDVKPNVIVNAAAYTAVDKAEDEEDLANLINGQAPGVIAAEAKKIGALLVHYSTDYVFDGENPGLYKEDDTPNPINTYGSSKLMGEEAISSVDMDYLILRTAWVYSSRGANILRTILRLSQEREELGFVCDQVGAPTWARLIAESTAHVIKQSMEEKSKNAFESGLYHLTAAGKTSWSGFAEAAVKLIRELPDTSVMVNRVNSITTEQYPLPAKRPKNSCMDISKLENHFNLKMPSWNHVLELCIDEGFPAEI